MAQFGPLFTNIKEVTTRTIQNTACIPMLTLSLPSSRVPELESSYNVPWLLNVLKTGVRVGVTPTELELLEGMKNCYSVCHANFEDTIGMVGGARGLSPKEVKQMLLHIKEKYSGEKEYWELRVQLPKEFPF